MNCIEMDTNMDEGIKTIFELQSKFNKEINETMRALVSAIKEIRDQLEMMKQRICNCYCHSCNDVKFWKPTGINNHNAILCCQCEVKKHA